MTPRASAFWRAAYRLLYRVLRLVDPLIRSWLALGLPGLGGVVDVRVAGRRTGRERRILVTLLTVDDRSYIGHPNGDTVWTRNVEAAATVTIERVAGGGGEFATVRLPAGDERDAVIAATRVQQPFPGNLIYGAANRHIRAVGVYFRLVAPREHRPDSA